MEKESILEYLNNNKVNNSEVLIEFLNNNKEHYSRNNIFGHITGSAFIVDNEMKNGLLILHKKYNKWLSPGGHVDENETSLMAAMRESGEEVGLNKLDLLSPKILDIDIHRVPESLKNGKVEPEHWHFDIRYIFKAQKEAVVDLNIFEAKGFKWNELKEMTTFEDVSVKRQAIKAIEIINKIKNKKKLKP